MRNYRKLLFKVRIIKLNDKYLYTIDTIYVYKVNLPINTYHAEFLKWNNPPSIYGPFQYHFRDIKTKT